MATIIEIYDDANAAWRTQLTFEAEPRPEVLAKVRASRHPVRVRTTAPRAVVAESPTAFAVRDDADEAEMLALSRAMQAAIPTLYA